MAQALNNSLAFARFEKIGAALLGVLEKLGSNSNGPFAVFTPAGFRPDANSPFARHDSIACGTRSDLATKIGVEHVGQPVLIVFTAEKPTAKHPQKLFTVHLLSAAEARAVMRDGKPLNPEWVKAPEVKAPAKRDAKASANGQEPLF